MSKKINDLKNILKSKKYAAEYLYFKNNIIPLHNKYSLEKTAFYKSAFDNMLKRHLIVNKEYPQDLKSFLITVVAGVNSYYKGGRSIESLKGLEVRKKDENGEILRDESGKPIKETEPNAYSVRTAELLYPEYFDGDISKDQIIAAIKEIIGESASGKKPTSNVGPAPQAVIKKERESSGKPPTTPEDESLAGGGETGPKNPSVQEDQGSTDPDSNQQYNESNLENLANEFKSTYHKLINGNFILAKEKNATYVSFKGLLQEIERNFEDANSEYINKYDESAKDNSIVDETDSYFNKDYQKYLDDSWIKQAIDVIKAALFAKIGDVVSDAKAQIAINDLLKNTRVPIQGLDENLQNTIEGYLDRLVTELANVVDKGYDSIKAKMKEEQIDEGDIKAIAENMKLFLEILTIKIETDIVPDMSEDEYDLWFFDDWAKKPINEEELRRFIEDRDILNRENDTEFDEDLDIDADSEESLTDTDTGDTTTLDGLVSDLENAISLDQYEDKYNQLCTLTGKTNEWSSIGERIDQLKKSKEEYEAYSDNNNKGELDIQLKVITTQANYGVWRLISAFGKPRDEEGKVPHHVTFINLVTQLAYGNSDQPLTSEEEDMDTDVFLTTEEESEFEEDSFGLEPSEEIDSDFSFPYSEEENSSEEMRLTNNDTGLTDNEEDSFVPIAESELSKIDAEEIAKAEEIIADYNAKIQAKKRVEYYDYEVKTLHVRKLEIKESSESPYNQVVKVMGLDETKESGTEDYYRIVELQINQFANNHKAFLTVVEPAEFTEAIIPSIESLKKVLEKTELYGGKTDEEMGRELVSTSILDLTNVHDESHSLDALENFSNIRILVLNSNGYKMIPDVVFKMRNLEGLSLRGNELNNDNFEQLKRLTNLEFLDIEMNNFTSAPNLKNDIRVYNYAEQKSGTISVEQSEARDSDEPLEFFQDKTPKQLPSLQNKDQPLTDVEDKEMSLISYPEYQKALEVAKDKAAKKQKELDEEAFREEYKRFMDSTMSNTSTTFDIGQFNKQVEDKIETLLLEDKSDQNIFEVVNPEVESSELSISQNDNYSGNVGAEVLSYIKEENKNEAEIDFTNAQNLILRVMKEYLSSRREADLVSAINSFMDVSRKYETCCIDESNKQKYINAINGYLLMFRVKIDSSGSIDVSELIKGIMESPEAQGAGSNEYTGKELDEAVKSLTQEEILALPLFAKNEEESMALLAPSNPTYETYQRKMMLDGVMKSQLRKEHVENMIRQMITSDETGVTRRTITGNITKILNEDATASKKLKAMLQGFGKDDLESFKDLARTFGKSVPNKRSKLYRKRRIKKLGFSI